ncbi:MAG: Unknown protein [uncultured Aureispira sp.]|uniref:Uncharacterized protein n=1 Tax=uncultured Aureispira sp. TaxID=1331704 RepID=A0A6S6TU49_9BACT|nr:MAG: Unknown protein [uncultured Aureispira sp.]
MSLYLIFIPNTSKPHTVLQIRANFLSDSKAYFRLFERKIILV